jgi:hypothetical protein
MLEASMLAYTNVYKALQAVSCYAGLSVSSPVFFQSGCNHGLQPRTVTRLCKLALQKPQIIQHLVQQRLWRLLNLVQKKLFLAHSVSICPQQDNVSACNPQAGSFLKMVLA